MSGITLHGHPHRQSRMHATWRVPGKPGRYRVSGFRRAEVKAMSREQHTM